MRYGSVCSGIESATVAWHPLGWEPQFFSEIEPFPCAVLAHHYPTVPNMGDMTKFKEWPDAAIDVLVGGTPCQSFSVAGLRRGLDDPRGNLMLTYLAIADRYRPRWLVWENVPGVLSSNGGRDFGTFLGGLGQLGYGFAYRVLDAQYFGVPQRRRRVFVVGYLGDWRRAAAVLFERHSLQGHTPPRRKKGEIVAGTITKGAFSGGAGGRPEGAAGNHFLPVGIDEECNATVDGFGPLLRGGQGGTRQAVAYSMITANTNANGLGVSVEVSPTLDRAQPCAVAFVQNTRDEVRLMGGDGQIAGALAAEPGAKQQCYVALPINTQIATRGEKMGEGTGFGIGADGDPAFTLQAHHSHAVAHHTAVRRLTPRECERLQGFPDDYTLISYRGKPAADGPRYKALGNSMNTDCMEWIGRRIQQADAL